MHRKIHFILSLLVKHASLYEDGSDKLYNDVSIYNDCIQWQGLVPSFACLTTRYDNRMFLLVDVSKLDVLEEYLMIITTGCFKFGCFVENFPCYLVSASLLL